MIVIFSLIISFCIAFVLLFFLFQKQLENNFRLIFNLSFPTSIGISSVFFIVLNLLKVKLYFIVGIESIILFFLFLKFYKTKQTISLKEISITSLFQQHIIFILLFVVYSYSWLMDVGIFYFDSIKEPHGLWDAWSYWNMKAKFIARAPTVWTNCFSQFNAEDFHGDYPLLQSAFIARCWMLIGNETVWIPIASAFVFTFCTIGLLSSAVKYFTNKTQGLIAGLILLCTPFYVTMGDSQYADVTLGFFFLATFVMLAFADNVQENKKYFLIASGIFATMAAWSKNEGLLFLLCLIVARVVVKIKSPRFLWQELKYIFLGMLPILLLIIYYKMAVAPTNDLLKSHDVSAMHKVVDWERYKIIGAWFLERVTNFGEWIVNPWWIFLIVIVVNGISNKNNIAYGFVLILLMLIGYFYSYIISYHDLQFHLSTSLHRLFFQLFPSFIFLFFLLLKTNKKNYL